MIFKLRGLIPFILFPANKETPKYIVYLGSVLSYAIIHIWKINTLLSICGGTIFYMLLAQFIFI